MHKNSDYLLSLRINKNTQAIIKRLNYSCKHFYLLLTFQLQTLQKAQQHSDHWCQPSPPSSQSPELLMYCQYYVELAGKHCFLHLKFRLYLQQFSPLFQYFLWQKWHFRLWLWQCCLHQLYLEEETSLQLHWSFCSLIDTCFRNNKHISKYFINSYPKFKKRSGGGGQWEKNFKEGIALKKLYSAKYQIISNNYNSWHIKMYLSYTYVYTQHMHLGTQLIQQEKYTCIQKAFWGSRKRSFWKTLYNWNTKYTMWKMKRTNIKFSWECRWKSMQDLKEFYCLQVVKASYNFKEIKKPKTHS